MTSVARDAGDAIVTRSLSRAFGARDVVSHVTLSARKGSLTGVVGPDGSGKTTFLRMLAAVLPPSSGDALIDGISVRDDPEGVKHRIGYMSQRFGLYASLTVAENIAFYADLYLVPRKERAARVEQLYAFSALGPFAGRLAGMLSGGMRRKLGLCCALVHQPSVLLLDEPTFGVDPLSRHDLWQFMHQMLAGDVTILLSTSYLDEAERCDRVALLSDGALLAYDEPGSLERARTNESAPPPSMEEVFIDLLGSRAPRGPAVGPQA